MEELRKLVERLEKATEEKQQISILQEIGAKLITDYGIQIGNLKIEPLLVEAYYCNFKSFCDCNCHQSPMQTGKTGDRFGKVYQHAKSVRNGGIDICLPIKHDIEDDNYYLSFLIKVALINGKVYKQEGINGEILKLKDIEDVQQLNDILRPCHKNLDTVRIPRKGTTKGAFVDTPLAVLAVDSFKDKSQNKAIQDSLENKFKKQSVLAKYALDNGKSDHQEIRSYIRDEKNLYNASLEEDYIKDAENYRELLIKNGWM